MASTGQQASISITSDSPSASHPRVALMGNVQIWTDVESTPDLKTITQCYLKAHPDAKDWIPGDDGGAHTVSSIL